MKGDGSMQKICDSEEPRDKNGLTEAEFLEAYDSDLYPKPSATADICVMAQDVDDIEILMIRRGNHPCLGRWALPGGFADKNEPLEETAARELEEETGITDVGLQLIGVYSEPGRDPRGWTISAAYAAIINKSAVTVCAGDDAAAAAWFQLIRENGSISLRNKDILLPVSDNAAKGTGSLAFDHRKIICDAVERFL